MLNWWIKDKYPKLSVEKNNIIEYNQSVQKIGEALHCEVLSSIFIQEVSL